MNNQYPGQQPQQAYFPPGYQQSYAPPQYQQLMQQPGLIAGQGLMSNPQPYNAGMPPVPQPWPPHQQMPSQQQVAPPRPQYPPPQYYPPPAPQGYPQQPYYYPPPGPAPPPEPKVDPIPQLDKVITEQQIIQCLCQVYALSVREAPGVVMLAIGLRQLVALGDGKVYVTLQSFREEMEKWHADGGGVKGKEYPYGAGGGPGGH
ncbi:hypothetical protein DL98DRAFT_119167 [Cadophora sp. DSE1049]|nr:hypothetical protein DL98DRAFT_119167 [Cadophora sp. DSE1049]